MPTRTNTYTDSTCIHRTVIICITVVETVQTLNRKNGDKLTTKAAVQPPFKTGLDVFLLSGVV